MIAKRVPAAVLAFFVLQAVALPEDKDKWVQVKQKPKADLTGMVPGDVLMGNLDSFPGHAGIYVGKWHLLPEALRKRYDKLHKHYFDTKMRTEALRDSYLVIDSYPGRHVKIASFAEQFTHYILEDEVEAIGALMWKSKHGAAIAYLEDDDMRRWRVIEEALKMIDAGVMYPEIPENPTAQDVRNYRQKAAEEAHLNDPYGTHDMDCITMVYVAYWRGAQMKLEAKGEKWALDKYAHMLKLRGDPRLKKYEGSSVSAPVVKGRMSWWDTRGKVEFKPVYLEAALLGPWVGRPGATTGGETVKKPFGVMINFRTSGDKEESAKEFELLEFDPRDRKVLSDKPLVALATLKPNKEIALEGSKGASVYRYTFHPLGGKLYVENGLDQGGKYTTVRGYLSRGFELMEEPEPNYELDIRYGNVYRRGPVHATVRAIRKDAKRSFGQPMVKAPYLVVVRLGQHTQYLYPANAVYPGAKPALVGLTTFSRFGKVDVQMLQPLALPDTMTVTAILPDGERVTKKVKVPYKTEAHPNWVLAELRYREQHRQKLNQALARPATDLKRLPQISSAGCKVLEWTSSREEASTLWRTVRDAIRGPYEKHYIWRIQIAQMKGAWLRGDPELYRTLVTQREAAGRVDAHDYLNLMIMLVRYRNDVEAARSYWPKFQAAVAKMSPREQKRFHYDKVLKLTLLLPAKRIRP
jgi:hypothetical protein